MHTCYPNGCVHNTGEDVLLVHPEDIGKITTNARRKEVCEEVNSKLMGC